VSVPPEIPPPGPDRPWPDPEIPAPDPQVPRPTPVPTPLPSEFLPGEPITDARAALLQQRRVLLVGALDDATATRAAAELMLLDGESSGPVDLVVNSAGGAMDAVLPLLDVIELMRAPVATRVIGSALGTAAVVVASGTSGRSAAPSALLSLRMDDRYDVNGRASDVERYAEHLGVVRQRIVAHLQRVTRLDTATLQDHLAAGAPLSAEAARNLGIIDQIASR
jgi:ATP-dependent Clp protease protease subunit